MSLPSIALAFLILCFGSFASNASPQEIDKEKINKVLKEVHELDQKYRFKADSLARAKADMAAIAIASLPIAEQDQKNRDIVFPIIDSIIHYQINDLDSLSYKTCFLVIQHSVREVLQLPKEKQKQYADFILSLAKDGYISKLNYAWFVDRMNVNVNKSQKYGVQANFLPIGQSIITILYPINDQYNRSWEELGAEFNKEAWESIDYPPILISEDQFAILGFIFKKGEIDFDYSKGFEAFEGVQVKINESNYTVTDGSGYFYFVVDKASIPDKIEVVTSTGKSEYEIEATADTDFIIVNYLL